MKPKSKTQVVELAEVLVRDFLEARDKIREAKITEAKLGRKLKVILKKQGGELNTPAGALVLTLCNKKYFDKKGALAKFGKALNPYFIEKSYEQIREKR